MPYLWCLRTSLKSGQNKASGGTTKRHLTHNTCLAVVVVQSGAAPRARRVFDHLGRSYQSSVDLGGDSKHGGRVYAESLFQNVLACGLPMLVKAPVAVAIVNSVADDDDDGGGCDSLRAHLSTSRISYSLAG